MKLTTIKKIDTHSRAFLLTIIAIGLIFSCHQENIAQEINVKDSIDSLLNEEYEDGNLNGNVLVVKNGKKLYEKSFGYADGTRNSPLSKNHRFNLGSIYKEFPAVAIMQLEEKHLLKLDDKIQKYLPELPSWSGKISIKHLMQYSSGLPRIDWGKYFSKNLSIGDEDVMNELQNIKNLEFQPETDYLYTNYSPILLMKIVEKVSKQSFSLYANEHLFSPFGLKNTEIKKQYPYKDKSLMAIPFDSEFKEDNYNTTVSGVLFSSTAEDIYKWFENLDTYRIVSKKSLQTLSETAKNGDNIQSPLGVSLWINNKLIEHSHHGSTANYESLVRRFHQDDLTIVIMTNRKRNNIHGLSNKIYEIVNNAFVPNTALQDEGRLKNNIGKILDEKIPTWQKELNVPNVGVGLIEDGNIISVKVYGKSAPKNMLFNIASVTKAVFASFVMKLVQEGKWDLDEPLYLYHVDADVINDPRHKKLTSRHILSQQSGFVNWRWNHPTKKLTFDFEPGTKFNYSGEGMEYLRKAIEKKFNKSLSELADEVLFTPIGMKDTRHAWNGETNLKRFSRWFDANGKEYKADYSTEDNAADDLLTTVEDLSKFGVDVINGAGLSNKLFAEMVKPQSEINQNLQQGLGWRVVNNLSNGEYAIQHGGNDIGVATLIVLLPESKRGVIVFTNSDNGLIICNNVVREVLPEGKEIIHKSYKSTSIDSVPKIVNVDEKTLSSYEGTYAQPSGRILNVFRKENSILIKMAGIPNLTLFPESKDTFFLLDFDTKLKFSKDEEGKVDEAWIIEGDNIIKCKRIAE